MTPAEELLSYEACVQNIAVIMLAFFLPAANMKVLLWCGRLNLSNKREGIHLELMAIIYLTTDSYCLMIMHIIWHGNVIVKNTCLANIILFHFCPSDKYVMSKISFSFWPLVPKECMNICYLYEMREVDLWVWKLTDTRNFVCFLDCFTQETIILEILNY